MSATGSNGRPIICRIAAERNLKLRLSAIVVRTCGEAAHLSRVCLGGLIGTSS